jgi:hypothetical protein
MIAATESHPETSSSKLQKQLVLFDFDGTITTKDTLAEFMIFYHGKLRYAAGLALLLPFIAAYIFKLMPNWKSKQYFLSHFLKDESATVFEKRCMQFSENYLPYLIRPGALEAINQYKKMVQQSRWYRLRQRTGLNPGVIKTESAAWQQNLKCSKTNSLAKFSEKIVTARKRFVVSKKNSTSINTMK